MLRYADGRGALSHSSALDVWGVRRQLVTEPVHLTVPDGTGMRSRPGLVVHRPGRFVVAPPQVLIRRGLPVIRIERALVEAWPLLPPVERPESLIRAVNDRLTTPERIEAALVAARR